MIPLPPEREDQLGEEAEARRRISARPEPEPLPSPRRTMGAVVVTFNDANHIALTLRGLVEQGRPGRRRRPRLEGPHA